MPDWHRVGALLADAGIHPTDITAARPVTGGDISAAFRVPTGDGEIFLKTGSANALDMFSAELDALQELAATNTVRVPLPLAAGGDDALSFLALEWLQLSRPNSKTHASFGAQLAALHGHTAQQHGWHRDNTIGSTPQSNTSNTDWVTFFREQRLRPQLALARTGGGKSLQESGDWLCNNLQYLFTDYEPRPSLLHGDLWGGNWAACDDGPVMFDPASYYGDRETDLAMTRLFGGFGEEFYANYEKTWPLSPGAEDRVALYQLYHVLNHLNLFGDSYRGQALALMNQLRERIRQ